MQVTPEKEDSALSDLGCGWMRQMQPGSACHQSCHQLWEAQSCASAIPTNASSSLSTDQCCLWTSSCSGASCLPQKMDVETGTDWCMFSLGSDMKKLWHFWVVPPWGFFIFIVWLASFLCSMSVPEKYMENGSLWGVGSSGLVQGTVRQAGNCKAKEREGSCMR